MARIHTVSEIDWTECEPIEQIPGKVSGRPIVRGTRILPDAIVNSYDAGGKNGGSGNYTAKVRLGGASVAGFDITVAGVSLGSSSQYGRADCGPQHDRRRDSPERAT